MKRLRALFGFLAAFLLLAGPAAAAAGTEPWPALQFLIGDWEGVGAPGQGRGSFSFSSDLQSRVIVRHNHAEYPVSEGRPAGTHDDLLVIYLEGAVPSPKAVYFDSEGHVIHYAVETGVDRVTFVSAPEAGAPRYRLSYVGMGDGSLAGKFETAPPGKPEAFQTYLEWSARRRAASPK